MSDDPNSPCNRKPLVNESTSPGWAERAERASQLHKRTFRCPMERIKFLSHARRSAGNFLPTREFNFSPRISDMCDVFWAPEMVCERRVNWKVYNWKMLEKFIISIVLVSLSYKFKLMSKKNIFFNINHIYIIFIQFII